MVLIGDSITDCGRRDQFAPYGDGYVRLFIDLVTAQFPDRAVSFINRGIGGDRVTGLRARWDEDVLAHRPDWVSVMIGINDLHSHLGEMPGGVDVALYRECYEDILRRTRERTEAQIVLLEPFYIARSPCDDPHQCRVMEVIPEYIAVVGEMSRRHDTRLVNTHDAFQRHLMFRPADVFCPEPVHPNRSGHTVIAWELVEALVE
jgi:lysophospholipase L1-like esterase